MLYKSAIRLELRKKEWKEEREWRTGRGGKEREREKKKKSGDGMNDHTGTKKGRKQADFQELPSRKKRASGNTSKEGLKQDDQETLKTPTTSPSEKLGAFAKLCYCLSNRKLNLCIRNLMIHKLLILVILE